MRGRFWVKARGNADTIRESTLRSMGLAAGFSSVDVLDVDGGFFRIYALRP